LLRLIVNHEGTVTIKGQCFRQLCVYDTVLITDRHNDNTITYRNSDPLDVSSRWL